MNTHECLQALVCTTLHRYRQSAYTHRVRPARSCYRLAPAAYRWSTGRTSPPLSPGPSTCTPPWHPNAQHTKSKCIINILNCAVWNMYLIPWLKFGVEKSANHRKAHLQIYRVHESPHRVFWTDLMFLVECVFSSAPVAGSIHTQCVGLHTTYYVLLRHAVLCNPKRFVWTLPARGVAVRTSSTRNIKVGLENRVWRFMDSSY